MIDSRLRPRLQTTFLDPLTDFIAKTGVTPNLVTSLAIASGLGSGLTLALHMPKLAIACLFASGLLDALDGSLARKLKASSSMGAALDIAGDRMVELAVVMGLYFYAPGLSAWSLLFLLGSFYLCITSFLLSGIFEKNHSDRSFHYSPGLIERGETFAFFFLVIIWPSIYGWAVVVFSLLVYATAFFRMFEILRNLSPGQPRPIAKTNPDDLDQATTRTGDR